MRKLLLSLGLLLGLCASAAAVVTSTPMGNAAYTALSTDQRILLTTAFTASRTLTLPAAGATCIGQTCPPFTLEIYDPTGLAINGANTLVIAPATGDTINGSSSSLTVTGIGVGGRLVLIPTSGTNWVTVFQGTGQALGTTTNDNACTGCVGEVGNGQTGIAPGSVPGNTGINATVVTSAPLMTTNVVANITQVLLTAGDWDCRGSVGLTPSQGAPNSVTQMSAWTSTSQANTPPVPTQFSIGAGSGAALAYPFNISYAAIQAAAVTSPTWQLATASMRYSLASATSVFLMATATFSAGNVGGVGALQCRRAR